MIQSILEGIAFRAEEVIGAMSNCVSINNALFIDGGMSKNPYFVQFLSNVMGREIRPASMPELTGLGTVQLACDVFDYELETVSHFASYNPEPGKRQSVDKFRQAVDISREWAVK